MSRRGKNCALSHVRVCGLASAAEQRLQEVDGFPVRGSDGQVLRGLAVCWGSRDAFYVSLQQEQSAGKDADQSRYAAFANSPSSPLLCLSVCCCCCSGFSSSLAPPPLDDDLALSERLAQVKACLAPPSANHRDRALITYDIIQMYKVLVLSCGISLEGSCEDPKVREITLLHKT